jgi:hypothetical protein
MKKRRSGRPTKYSQVVVHRLCGTLADGMPIRGACVVAGIGVTTLAEWREKHPRLEDRMSEARELARQNALQGIKAASEKDWRAHVEWLKLTFRDDYCGPANKVEVQQSMNVLQVSDDMLRDLRSRLGDARKLLCGRHTSAPGEASTGGTKYDEEIDAEQSRQNLPDSADSVLRSCVQLNYAGQPMQPGEPYGGRPSPKH